MAEGKSLNDILDDEPSEEVVEVQAEPTPEAEPEVQTEGQPRDETGKFAKKGDDDGAPPAPDKNEYDGAATLAERRKRQEAEQRLQALEQELQALRNPPAPPPNMFEDEQAWQQHFGGEVVSRAVQQASLNATLNTSEMLARQANPDFEEVKAQFLELAEQHPELREQALSDPHPWAKAYQIAKTHRTMKDLGATDIEGLKAQLRQELMAEMGQAPNPQGVPPTLSTERNLGSRGGPSWSGPKPLDELLS